MTITILSPYRVFFADNDDKLWVVLKDGRIRFIKKIPSFARFSSDHTLITGVVFNGRTTDILWDYAEPDTPRPKRILSHFGYCYYPVLENKVHPRMALFQADLLNPAGTGNLLLYQKARTKFHLTEQIPAALVPPVFAHLSAALYYVAVNGDLIRRVGQTETVLAPHVQLFTLTPDEEGIVWYDGEALRGMVLATGQVKSIAEMDVTAIGLNREADTVFFATSRSGINSLYEINRLDQEVTLVTNHPAKITIISY